MTCKWAVLCITHIQLLWESVIIFYWVCHVVFYVLCVFNDCVYMNCTALCFLIFRLSGQPLNATNITVYLHRAALVRLQLEVDRTLLLHILTVLFKALPQGPYNKF